MAGACARTLAHSLLGSSAGTAAGAAAAVVSAMAIGAAGNLFAGGGKEREKGERVVREKAAGRAHGGWV